MEEEFSPKRGMAGQGVVKYLLSIPAPLISLNKINIFAFLLYKKLLLQPLDGSD
jgi:hypothetical protein